MTQNSKIAIVIPAFKDNNLRSFVDHISSVSSYPLHFNIFDQHSIDHADDFKDIEYYCAYEHKIWDDIGGPCKAKMEKIRDMLPMDYICVISPDIKLNHGWDKSIIEFINSQQSPTVVSGIGMVELKQPNIFDIVAEYSPSDVFNKTQFIDRNFFFAKSDSFTKIRYPEFLKYAGEQEYLSVAFLSANFNIWSAPSSTYTDIKTRSIETKYATFSKEHNYNIVIDILHGKNLSEYRMTEDGLSNFINHHGINLESLKRLPYATNDVSYDPYKLAMHDVDARRFITGVKAIY